MYRILIVEDEMMISEDLKRTLTGFDYNIIGVFEKGEDVLHEISVLKPDLMIMDIQLEGKLSGIDTARMIRNKQDIPVIFLTAYADDVTIETAKSAEPYSYIVKPFDEKELKASIEMTMLRHESQKALKLSNTKFESLFMGIPEPAVYLDNTYRIVDINKRFTEFFGYNLDEVRGKLILDLIVPETRIKEAKELTLNSKSCFIDTVRKNKAGELLDVAISSAQIKVDEKQTGTFIIYKDISKRKEIEEEREKLISDLKHALEDVKTLSGLIPICSHCKKVRDDSGYWEQVEYYLAKYTNADFSHGICPDCMKQYYPRMYDKLKKNGKI
ncbi:response regulator [Candidatus Cloacimonadota bacterium]